MPARALTTARHSPPARLATSGQLMAQGTSLLIPRLDGVPLVDRLVADDRMAVMLAKALVGVDIAVPVDWKKAERDPLLHQGYA